MKTISGTLRGLAAVTAIWAGVALCAPAASAQTVAPAYNWTGFYVGANVGGAFGREHNSLSVINDEPTAYFFPPAIPGVNSSGSFSLNDSGVTGGVQGGYNRQSGALVYGVEADFNWLGLSTDRGGTFLYTTNDSPYVLTGSASTDWLATVRPRVGIAVDSWLFYVTGGLALARSRFEQAFAEPPFTPIPETASESKTRVGFTAGAGLEIALGGPWTAKVEYLYARFGGSDVVGRLANANGASPVPGLVDGATFINSVSALDLHLTRVGVNFRFR